MYIYIYTHTHTYVYVSNLACQVLGVVEAVEGGGAAVQLEHGLIIIMMIIIIMIIILMIRIIMFAVC